MIVHACHCTICRRRTGSAFAVNLWIERERVHLLKGELNSCRTPGIEGNEASESWSCSNCSTTLWTQYGDSSAVSWFVRAGTLDEPGQFPPDVHIFTRSKLPWVTIPDNAAAHDDLFVLKTTWPAECRKRLRALMTK
jgi:hypothetical protein